MESLRPVGQSGAHPVVIGMETCASGSQSFGSSSACSMVASSHGGQLFGGRQGRGTGGVSMVIG